MSRDTLIASILSASSPKPVKVEADGIGPVFVRVMTAFDADYTRKQLADLKAEDGCETGRLLACLLVDEDGTLLFDVTNAETVLKLSKLPPGVSTKVLNAANAANGAEPGKP
jgi:hypothetical protein